MADLDIITSDLETEGLDYENVELESSDLAQQSVSLNTSELTTAEADIETADFFDQELVLETSELDEETTDLGGDELDVVYSGFSPDTDEYLRKFLKKNLGTAAYNNTEDFATPSDIDDADHRIVNLEKDVELIESNLNDKVSKSERDTQHMKGTLRTDKDLMASGGVSARGITDLSVTPSGGGQPLEVISYDNLDDLQNEELDQVATAYAVSRLKKDIGMANIPEFNSMMSYNRGDVVRYGTRGYRFITNKEPGQWDPSYCDYLEYAALAKPLPISRRVIENLKLD